MKDSIHERQKGELDEIEGDDIAYCKHIEALETVDEVCHEDLRLERINVLAESMVGHSEDDLRRRS